MRRGAQLLLQVRNELDDVTREMDALNASADGRPFTPDQQRQWDDLDARAAQLARERTRLEDGLIATSDGNLGDLVPLPDPNARGEVAFDRPLPRHASFADLPGDAGPNVDRNLYWRAMLTGDFGMLPREQRALGEAVSSSGGLLVPIGISNRVWDLARARAYTQQAGVQIVPLNEAAGEHAVPVQTADPAPKWVGETGPVPEDDAMQFGGVVLHPKALAVIVRVSWNLIQDAAVDIASVVERAMARKFALELDRVTLRGGAGVGDDELVPIGIRATPNIPTTGSIGALHYDDLLDAMSAVEGRDYTPNAIIGAVRDDNTLAKLKEATTLAYLRPPAKLESVAQYWTTQVPANLGGGTNESEIYVGQWDQAVVGVRRSFALMRLSEKYADSMQLGFLAWLRADVAVIQPNAFQVLTGVTP